MTARLECSFCCKSDAEVEKLVAGAGGGHICDECAEIAVRIMRAPSGETWIQRLARWLRSPRVLGRRLWRARSHPTAAAPQAV